MEIKRINGHDPRFSRTVLLQHGGFTVDGDPYEVEIISENEAVIRGDDPEYFPAVIDEFRFYAPHIVKFYDSAPKLIKAFQDVEIVSIRIEEIQPSQFYVDREKIAAVSGFIEKPEDIIIQAVRYGDRYISLDGHTRLYYAVMKGWRSVRAVIGNDSEDWIYRFVGEAKKRGIFAPKDMIPLDHEEYEEKWIGFCDKFFAGNE